MTARVGRMTALAARVRALARDRTIDSVIARMLEIEAKSDGFFSPRYDERGRDQRAAPPDGVACFNALYLRVTQTMRRHLDDPSASGAAAFRSTPFVRRLIPVFAEFYFQAFDAAAAHAWVPNAWAPLFRQSEDRRVVPLAFAAAGMNAHINHDLAYALVQVWDEAGCVPTPSSPEHEDFLTVNDILLRVKDDIKPILMDPFVGRWDRRLGETDDAWAMTVIRSDRERAWDDAVDMHSEPAEVELERGEPRMRDYDRRGHAWRGREVGAQSQALLFPIR